MLRKQHCANNPFFPIGINQTLNLWEDINGLKKAVGRDGLVRRLNERSNATVERDWALAPPKVPIAETAALHLRWLVNLIGNVLIHSLIHLFSNTLSHSFINSTTHSKISIARTFCFRFC